MVRCQKGIKLIITIICLLFKEQISAEDPSKSCKFFELEQCGENESCEQTDSHNHPTGSCVCISGYQRFSADKKCEPINPAIDPDAQSIITPTPSMLPGYSSSHIVVGILIPLVLVALALCLVYAAKRYQWLQKLRAMRQRRYDEVQFGQEEDDPPLA